MTFIRATLSALIIAVPVLGGSASAAPAVPAVAKPAPMIRACNAAFREDAYIRGFAAARGLYSECLESNEPDAQPVKSQARTPKSFLGTPPAAQARKKSCHSFTLGGASRVCVTTALIR